MSIATQQIKTDFADSCWSFAGWGDHYDPSWGWSSTKQPLSFSSPGRYIEQCNARLPQIEREIERFTATLPFITGLIAPCLKTEDSALRKVFDLNSSAGCDFAGIRDYARFTITARNVQDLIQVIGALDNFDLTVARKNRFHTPEPETGMRDYKAIWLVDDILVEAKVELDPMKDAYDRTKTYRETERNLKEFAGQEWGVARFDRMCADARDIANSLRTLRKDVHDLAAERCGANLLLHSALKNLHGFVTEATVNGHIGAVRSTPLGKKVLQHLKPEGIFRAAGWDAAPAYIH